MGQHNEEYEHAFKRIEVRMVEMARQQRDQTRSAVSAGMAGGVAAQRSENKFVSFHRAEEQQVETKPTATNAVVSAPVTPPPQETATRATLRQLSRALDTFEVDCGA